MPNHEFCIHLASALIFINYFRIYFQIWHQWHCIEQPLTLMILFRNSITNYKLFYQYIIISETVHKHVYFSDDKIWLGNQHNLKTVILVVFRLFHIWKLETIAVNLIQVSRSNSFWIKSYDMLKLYLWSKYCML